MTVRLLARSVEAVAVSGKTFRYGLSLLTIEADGVCVDCGDACDGDTFLPGGIPKLADSWVIEKFEGETPSTLYVDRPLRIMQLPAGRWRVSLL